MTVVEILEVYLKHAVEAQSPDGLDCPLLRKYFKGQAAGLRLAIEEIKNHEDYV